MRKLFIFFLLLAIGTTLFDAGKAKAASNHKLQTGADLLNLCKAPADNSKLVSDERERLRVCGAYIQGFLSHYSLTRTTAQSTFCLPEKGTNPEHVRQLFVALISQKPEIRDLPASINLTASLTWGFPCNKPGAKAS